MARTTRIKRAPNREPTSLAAGIANLGGGEALDPLLTNSDTNQPPEPPEPPEPPLEFDSQYPPPDYSLINRYIYPPSPPLPLVQRELSWSPTPPPPSPPAPLPPP